MQLNFTKITVIVLLSSALGLVVNHFNSKSLPLVYQSKELGWAGDSIVDISLEQNSSVQNVSKGDDISASEGGSEYSEKDSEGTAHNNNSKEKEETSAIPAPVKINVESAYKLYNKGVLFIDARPIEEFTEGHIQGAVTLPYYSENHETTLSRIPKDEPVVVYCSGTDCDLSIMMGNKLHELGYQKVFVFFGGWSEWLDKKYPVELAEEN